MSTRREQYSKFIQSDIFNLKTNQSFVQKPKKLNRKNQPTLEATKNDVFNIGDKNNCVKNPIKKTRKLLKRNESDIFNIYPPRPTTNRPTLQKLRNLSNVSTCFDSMKNNLQYKNDLTKYENKHRPKMQDYNPDKYFKKDTANDRYYDQLYNNHENAVLPVNNDNNKNTKEMIKKQNEAYKKIYTHRKIEYKNKNKVNNDINKSNKYHGLKKEKWTEKNSGAYTFIDPNKYPKNSTKITKQLNLESNIFKPNNDNTQKNNNIEKINEKINEEIKKEKILNDLPRLKYSQSFQKLPNVKNINNGWGSVNSGWTQTNVNWYDPKTQIMFNNKSFNEGSKTLNETDDKNYAFNKKMSQLANSENVDIITNEKKDKIDLTKINKSTCNDLYPENDHLEKINEMFEEIPDNVLSPCKKQRLINNATLTKLNGDEVTKKDLEKYLRTEKPIYRKKEVTGKIMSNGNKIADKKALNLKKHKDYNEQDYVISYGVKKNNFDNYGEDDIKKIFSKKGIHVYEIKKNNLNSGDYNTVNLKIRENEGEKNLQDKIKSIQRELLKDNCTVSIKKSDNIVRKKNNSNIHFIGEKNTGKNEENKKNDLSKSYRKNFGFSKQFNQINYSYKNNY